MKLTAILKCAVVHRNIRDTDLVSVCKKMAGIADAVLHKITLCWSISISCLEDMDT